MKQVLQQALDLSPSERFHMALQLLASLEPVWEDQLSPETVAELDRRAAALASGEDPGISGIEFLAKLRERVIN